MKDITAYINEGLFGLHKKIKPKDKEELRKILEERLAKDKDADLNDIDVSKIDNMEQLFYKLDPHNIKIDKWDVSNVKDMSYMFSECENFEGKGLENWNVSNVEDMSGMFSGGHGANRPYCKNFNCDLGKWDVSNVVDLSYMFKGCEKFEGKGLENWKPAKCKHAGDMLLNCKSLIQKPKWYTGDI